MFIQCSDCKYKYLVNSADLKPNGRLVECANCNHQWFQKPSKEEELISKSDTIINFAAQSHVDRSISDANPFLVSNIRGVFTILDILKEKKKKMIQISTD